MLAKATRGEPEEAKRLGVPLEAGPIQGPSAWVEMAEVSFGMRAILMQEVGGAVEDTMVEGVEPGVNPLRFSMHQAEGAADPGFLRESTQSA
jgi:hypothetical protein